ncbi:restriction endonuclease subunit S [Proteus sp. GOKU]|uniref:restriction endonuclease subunit S n=1 Tax=Proteus TaxID=583 RepID=UPI0018929C93|nr:MULTISPECIES: restriction endonuclease subunit S [Proteus]QPB78195.1 restriction endonuclease subunit S [Proteus sp. GOKU]QQP24202.1 restriction endonuclease subunit S [Proteus vulgaris]
MVPNGWKRQPLEQVAEVRSGVAKGKTGLKDPVTVPYLRVANVQDGHINLEDVKEIEIERDKLERFSLKKGDVLMNEGGDFDKLGRGDVWLGQIEPCLHQNHVFAVRPDQELIDSFFLAALAASNYGKTYFLSCAKRSTNLASINSTQIKVFPVLVPPLPEQKKIAEILSTWDKAITTTEQLLANSQQQKKALMQQLLTGKKRLLDKNGVRFSGEWKWSKIQEVGMVVTGSTPPKSDENNYGGDVLWATAEDFTGKYVSDTKIKLSDKGSTKARIVPKGSVLVTCIASIGKNAIANEDMGTNQQINAVVVSDSFSNEFFYYQIEFNVNKLISIAGVTAVPIVNKSSFQQVKLIFPVLEEQQKIAAVLSTADQEISALQQKLEALKQEKKALMQQLLTGKRRVKIDDKEVA